MKNRLRNISETRNSIAIAWQAAVLCVCLIHPVIAQDPLRYDITAVLDPAQHTVSARQKVIFTNPTSKPLKEIYFHVYPHRKYTEEEVRFIYRYAGYFKINPFPEGFQAGDLKIESIAAGGKSLVYRFEGNDQTIMKVSLEKELNPQESIEIDILFQVDIPHAYGRFGWHKDIITMVRWYPIACVVDGGGWHNYPFYLYHQPYFSNAAHYRVTLTLPRDQVVASTGHVQSSRDNPDGTKTLFIETEYPVRDFSLGVSARFKVHTLKAGHCRIQTYYLQGDEQRAAQAAEYARDLMHFYAARFGEYPYRQFNIVSSFLGYGGVQSSNQVFIDTRAFRLPKFLNRYFDFLVSHETGHQWFFNMVGSDEYKEMFLDEGVNSFWVLQYLEHKYGYNAQVMELSRPFNWFIPNFSFRQASIARYVYMATHGLDSAVISDLSSFQEPSSIFAITYGKGAGVLEMLRQLIGDDAFTRAMKRYTQEFRFKNIRLDDFMRIFNEESGQDLRWFFDEWLKTKRFCDLAIKSVRRNVVVVENRGSIRMPVEVKVWYKDGTEELLYWDGKGVSEAIPLKHSEVKKIQVDPDNKIIFDLDRTNNAWPASLRVKAVPLYYFAYEIPVFLSPDSYHIVAGPSVGGSSLGLASSVQKPNDAIVRISSVYDSAGSAVDSKLSYELNHLFNKQYTAGFEFFNYESSKEKNDLSGGKLYLRKELWPASYGLLDLNDHVTFYLMRDKKLESAAGLAGQENADQLHYLKRDEAIIGVTGSFGRYGPYADPVCGWKIIPTQEIAGHFLGGHSAFWRTSLDMVNYHLLIPRSQHKIATRVKTGWGEPSDKKLFQLGGPEGLRGFSFKTVEGAHMVLGSLEYRAPLASDSKLYFLDNIFCLHTVQAVGFFDIGKAWDSDFDGSRFKKDIGVGLRFHFDLVGFLEKLVVRIDVAQAVPAHKEEPHVWFGVSQTF
ncbi:MAG: hypothetical protein C4540_02605 [Candidatus Omnitrophota bacterium]|nr:MAG: hypothetical protein C4540_02605 [Candidatus Omnitrophota bacterium]